MTAGGGLLTSAQRPRLLGLHHTSSPRQRALKIFSGNVGSSCDGHTVPGNRPAQGSLAPHTQEGAHAAVLTPHELI